MLFIVDQNSDPTDKSMTIPLIKDVYNTKPIKT